MIEISLKELNDSYPSLTAVARQMVAPPLKFRLLPVLRQAKEAIADIAENLAGIALECGAEVMGDNRFTFPPDQPKMMAEFNSKASRWLKSETIEFRTDQSKYLLSEVQKCENPKDPTNADDLANLHWLFTCDVEDAKPEKEKAATATA